MFLTSLFFLKKLSVPQLAVALPAPVPEPPKSQDMMAIEQPTTTTVPTNRDNFKDRLLNKSGSINQNYNHTMGKCPIMEPQGEMLWIYLKNTRYAYTNYGNTQ